MKLNLPFCYSRFSTSNVRGAWRLLVLLFGWVLLASGQGRAAVATLGTTSSQYAATDTLPDFTVQTGSNRLLVVVASHAGALDVTSVSFGAQAMTKAIEEDDAGVAVDSIWYLPLGTNTATMANITVTYGSIVVGAAERFISATAFSGVDQMNPVPTAVADENPSSPNNASSSTVIACAVGDLAFDVFDTYKFTAPSIFVGPGQSQLSSGGGPISSSTGNAGYRTSIEAGTGSVTMSWTSDAEAMIHCTINIKQGASAPTVVSPTSGSVTGSTASLGGDVTSDGGSAITERGVVYSITTANNDPVIGGPGVTKVSTGGTTGGFSIPIGGLTGNTGYSFKAYAINAINTTYTSPTSTFTTLNNSPVLDASRTPVLSAVNEDSGAPIGAVGTSVMNLVDASPPSGGLDNVFDTDNGAVLGIAVIDADTLNGTWFFSTDGGANWFVLGAPFDGDARLLAADPATRLYFQPVADFNGSASIIFRAWDRTTGVNGGTAITFSNGGNTAYSSAIDTAFISINPLNDAPVLASVEGAALAYSEGDAAATISNTLTLTEVDGDSIVSATITITGNFANGQDVLSVGGLPGGMFSFFSNGTLSIGGPPQTAATYESILRTVKFQNTSEDPSTAQRTVSFQVDDGSGVNNLSNIGTRDITVASINDAPVVYNIEGSTIAYTENDPATVITAAISIIDQDNTSFVGAMVVVAGNFYSGQDVLEFANQNGISGSYDGGTGVLTLSGAASLADYETALRSVTYRNTSDNPNPATRTVTFQLNDGGAANNLSSMPTRTIAVTAVNDAPVIATQNAVSTPEETDRLIDFADLNVTDVDNAYPTGFTLTVLAGTNYTFSGNTITPAIDFIGTLTVHVKVNDGTDDSNIFDLSVIVTAVNDDPVAVSDALERNGTQAAKIQVSKLLLNDTDVDGGALSITSVQGALPAGATVTRSGNWVYYTPPSGSTLPGSFTYTTSDGNGGTATGTVAVTIKINEAVSLNLAKMELEDTGGGVNQMHLYFLGIPGRTYQVQYTDSLTPASWQSLTTVVADSKGKYEAIDPPTLPPSRFYRSVAQ